MKTASKRIVAPASILLCVGLLTGVGISHADEPITAPPELTVGELQLIFEEGVDPKNLQAMVEETWARSQAMRTEALAGRMTQTVGKAKSPNTSPPDAPPFRNPDDWMAALQQKKWLPEANAYIRGYVPEILKGVHSDLDASTIWYCYFGPGGKYPDRLEPETVDFLKETMWNWANRWLSPEGTWLKSRTELQQGKPYELLPLDWGKAWSNENIEIRYKPPLYLVLDALRKDPEYAQRRMGDKTVAEWFVIFKAHMIDLLRDRVMAGMWIEPGSTYVVDTYFQLVRLYNVAPDPEVRQMAKMVLDLVLIEDATLCVNGVRGGGRSRAHGVSRAKQDGIKELLYGESLEDYRARIEFELSDYQAPAIAIVLHRAPSAVKPYVIYNRVPGEIIKEENAMPLYLRDSRLVNYVYRTPGYSLGCTLMNPNATYHATSNQERMSSLLFQSKQFIYPVPKRMATNRNSGRTGKAFWSIQHENVMMLQQFVDSQSVEAVELIFSGGLNIKERDGWIFAATDGGYAAVCFIDPTAEAGATGYRWEDYKSNNKDLKGARIATPTGKFLPILIHAGDPDKDGSFEQFQKTVLEGKLTIDMANSRIDYQPKAGALITWFYDHNAQPLKPALVNGQPPILQPSLVFDGPFLKAKFGEPRVYVGAGPYRAVYDLSKLEIQEAKQP